MFMTDDSMHIGTITIEENITKWLSQEPTQNQFSLCLGIKMNDMPTTIIKTTENYLE